MKNKKILTRFGAIFAALLLVAAMALPCFADVNSYEEQWRGYIESISGGNPDRVINSAISYEFKYHDPLEVYGMAWFECNRDLVPEFCSYGLVAPLLDGGDGEIRVVELYYNGFLGAFGDYDDPQVDYYMAFQKIEIEIEIHYSVNIYFYDNYDQTVAYISYAYDNGDFYLFDFAEMYIDDGDTYQIVDDRSLGICYCAGQGDMYAFNDLAASMTDDTFFVAFPSSYLTGALSSDVEVDEPEAGLDGMYNDLFETFKGAIYGDVTLTPDQMFVLTQMATWLSWIVILLPILVVVAIVIRFFR